MKLSNSITKLHELENEFRQEFEAVAEGQEGTFEAQADERRLSLSGYVGDQMVERVENALEEMGSGPIEVRINSDGGSVFAGWSIYNALREHDGEVTSVANAMAASAASIIFLAGDVRQVSRGGRVMVHRARIGLMAFVTGPKLREMSNQLAGILESIDNEIIDLVAERSSLSRSDAENAVDSETYYTGAQAVKNGIATRAQKGSKPDRRREKPDNESPTADTGADVQAEAAEPVPTRGEDGDEIVDLSNEEIQEFMAAARFRQQVWRHHAR